ncbi:hypothetical protein Q7A53_02690 [Halobacillus rhizosphaerae]|uniref:YphA family membrane protein n=1 Tax=Halobacillus rhizosphaerae TaxID=3064889 RepID=UPI00398A9905
MTAQYYWYGWVIIMIAYFFLPPSKVRNRILFFCFIVLNTYSFINDPIIHDYLQLGLLYCFGLSFWLIDRRSFVDHFWPFILSMVYTSIQMFLVVHPVWTLFPGFHLGWILAIILLDWFDLSFSSLIGLWFILNSCGAFLTMYVFSVYGVEQFLTSEQVIVTTFKGLVIIFILHGISRLKKAVRRGRKSRNKGAAYV